MKIEGDVFGKKIVFETGELAPQADASVVVSIGDTKVLTTVVSKPSSEELDFFPLKIEYEERYYAGGLISGSRFTRREGRPTDQAVVEGRLIDHAIRPLFPKDFMYDTQIVITVLSIDGENSPLLAGFLGVSAALSLSGLPFDGPIVPLRIQKINGEIKADLSESDEEADMDMIVSYLNEGSKIQAIEAHAHIVPEKEVYESLKIGTEKSKDLFKLLNQLAKESGVSVKEYNRSWLNKDFIKEFTPKVLPEVQKWYEDGLYYASPEWAEKQSELINKLAKEHEDTYSAKQIYAVCSEIQKNWVRDLVVNKKKRIDGRGFDDIRPLSAKVGLLPRSHGSALFNRGLTQSLSITTLASQAHSLTIQGMKGEAEKVYFHHYNFPPYSTGEVGRVGVNRRATGHGMLAEKALLPVLPGEEDFAYAMRVVSEVLSSNGSTSMAATCASSLSLMDAGVPIKSHVGAIGVGIFVDKSNENPSSDDYILLTDIIGYEDFAGYMDFKMTGTRDGMTAIQLELKLHGLPVELFEKIFDQSRNARMKVLDVMDSAIDTPRSAVSQYAPKVESITIEQSQIGQVIGSGGSVIKEMSEMFDVEINVDEKDNKGIVSISSAEQEKIDAAKNYIISMLAPVEVGDVYEGKVTRIEDYGAFVEIGPGKTGLLHVSELSYEYVSDVNEVLKMDDVVEVKVISMDNGKISVSKKALEEAPEGYEERPSNDRRPRGNGGRGQRRGGPRGRRDNGRGRGRSGFNNDGEKSGAGYYPYSEN